jgi:hypothetical protein
LRFWFWLWLWLRLRLRNIIRSSSIGITSSISSIGLRFKKRIINARTFARAFDGVTLSRVIVGDGVGALGETDKSICSRPTCNSHLSVPQLKIVVARFAEQPPSFWS